MNKHTFQKTLSYLHAEMNRIETMAGNLAAVEQEHYRILLSFDHEKLNDLALEEQNGARQLGAIRQMCGIIAIRLQELQELSRI